MGEGYVIFWRIPDMVLWYVVLKTSSVIVTEITFWAVAKL